MPSPQHKGIRDYRKVTNVNEQTRDYTPLPETRGDTYWNPTLRVIHKKPDINPKLCLWLDASDDYKEGYYDEIQVLDKVKIDTITFDSGAGTCEVVVSYIVGEDRHINIQLQESGADTGVKNALSATKGSGTITHTFTEGTESLVEVDDIDKVTAFITATEDSSAWAKRITSDDEVVTGTNFSDSTSLSPSTDVQEWNDAGGSDSLRQRLIERTNYAYKGIGDDTTPSPHVLDKAQNSRRGVKFEAGEQLYLDKRFWDYHTEMEVIGAVKWHNGESVLFTCGDLKISILDLHIKFYDGTTNRSYLVLNSAWQADHKAVIVGLKIKQNRIIGYVNGEEKFDVSTTTPFWLTQNESIPTLGATANTGSATHLEWLGFNDSLTAEEQEFAEAYLACKWGITLWSQHIYYDECLHIDAPHPDCVSYYTYPDTYHFTSSATTSWHTTRVSCDTYAKTYTVTGPAYAAGAGGSTGGQEIVTGTGEPPPATVWENSFIPRKSRSGQSPFVSLIPYTTTRYHRTVCTAPSKDDEGNNIAGGGRTFWCKNSAYTYIAVSESTGVSTWYSAANTGTFTTEREAQTCSRYKTTRFDTVVVNCTMQTYGIGHKIVPCPWYNYGE